MLQSLTIGIDAGGTHTRAVLSDPAGALLASVQAGPGNYQALGDGGVQQLISDLLMELQTQSGRDLPAGSVCLCVGMAGAGRKDDQQQASAAMTSLEPIAKAEVVSDARIALEGAHGGNPGIVVIAGTGSMVLGRNGQGNLSRAGGLGPILGDEGSAYRLVIEALQLILRWRDGWGPEIPFADELRTALGLDSWDGVIGQLYQDPKSRHRFAAASPVLFAAARGGDPQAIEIIERQAGQLGLQAAAVAKRLEMDRPDIAGLGGLFRERELLWRPIVAGFEAAGLQAELVEARLQPVFGALLMARTEAAQKTPSRQLERWSEYLLNDA
ncbi:MAG: BadF/BadG/BcrA/BcrD ATPase family protein [Candidatus Latescibacterota bacterium]|nr:BadF/BadG/BcrA/BcrD ATPase family protein [Candidatus Latescibacterota bacterium]